MKKLFLVTIVILIFAFSTFSQTPKFADYKVNKIYTGKNAKPIITGDDRMFRTRIREASKNKVNFAGRYIVETIGCGTSCNITYILDAMSGKVYGVPFSICCEFDYENPDKTRDIERVSFRLNSNLIIFAGLRNEDGVRGFHFYKFENGRLKFIKTIKY